MSDGKLIIIYDGHVLFEDTVDKVDFNHAVHRRVGPLDEPKPAAITLNASYEWDQPVDDRPSRAVLDTAIEALNYVTLGEAFKAK